MNIQETMNHIKEVKATYEAYKADKQANNKAFQSFVQWSNSRIGANTLQSFGNN